MKQAFITLLVTVSMLAGTALSAQAKDILGPGADCSGSNGTGSSAVCSDTSAANKNASDNPIVDKLHQITNIIARVAGAAAILLLLVGSLQYITANGDSSKAANARNTIIYALVGVVVVFLAAAIIEFMLDYI